MEASFGSSENNGAVVHREAKRYKTKSKTEFLPVKTDENSDDQSKTATRLLEGESPVGMSIQERLAALKRNGEEEWKKRNTVNIMEDDNAQKAVSLVKQQQQQLKQQLQMASPQSIGQLRLNSELRRAILAPLNDNSQEMDEVKPNRYLQSEETNDGTITGESEEVTKEKRVPLGKRIMFDSAEFNANLSKRFFKKNYIFRFF